MTKKCRWIYFQLSPSWSISAITDLLANSNNFSINFVKKTIQKFGRWCQRWLLKAERIGLKSRKLFEYFEIWFHKNFRLLIVQHENSNEEQQNNNLSILWNGFLILLNDSNIEVMAVVAKNLSDIFHLFSRDPSEGLLGGSICNNAAVRISSWVLFFLKFRLIHSRLMILRIFSIGCWNTNVESLKRRSLGVPVFCAFKLLFNCLFFSPAKRFKQKFFYAFTREYSAWVKRESLKFER